MIEHIKMMQIPYLDIWSMFLSGQVPHNEQFKSLVLESRRPYVSSNTVLSEKNNLPPILIGFFHKLISMQDVGHNMFHAFTFNSTAAISLI